MWASSAESSPIFGILQRDVHESILLIFNLLKGIRNWNWYGYLFNVEVSCGF